MGDEKTKNIILQTIGKHNLKNITAEVKENIVTLKGKVDSYKDYVDIGLHVGNIKDVKGVLNDIEYPNKRKKTRKTGKKEIIDKANVVIIGGGIIGCIIARELSKFKLKIILVEKAEDVSCGATKANNAMVHSGIGEKLGTLKQRLCVKGHYQFEKLSKELNVPYTQCGMFIILTKDTFSNTKIPSFISNFISKRIIPFIIMRRGKKMGLPLKLVKKDELLREEPWITNKALVAVSSPTYGITSPYEFAIALAENAIENGVKIHLETEVVNINVKDNQIKSVVTPKGTIETSFIINAAGVFADEIAEMAGDRKYTIHPRKGSTILFDKEYAGSIKHNLSVLKFPRKEHTKGGGVMVTTHGNIQWGPTAHEISDLYDKSVSAEEIDEIFKAYSPLLPGFPKKSVITYFAGIRSPTFTEDYVIEASRKVKGFVDVAGIQSPGIAAAPAIAKMVVDILKKEGLSLDKKNNFNPVRKKPVVMHELSIDQRKKMIKKNPLYGRIVCRCEHITEGEIVDAINSPLPALNIDAIKRRTRAGMGRCQSGFCLPRVAKILARETGKPIEEIRKNSEGSSLFIGKAKCLLEGKNGKN